MRLIAVKPTGSEEVMAFWDGHDAQGKHIGGYGPHLVQRYPESPRGKALRGLRVQLGLSLRDAARAFGIGAAALSGLERGSFTLGGEGDWRDAEAVLRRLAERRARENDDG